MKLRLPTLTPRLTRWLFLAGFPLFYLVCLVLFARLTFPYDRVKNRILAEFDARQTGPNPKRLTIEEVSGYGLFGIEAEGVQLISTPPKKSTTEEGGKEKEPKPSILSIDSLHGSVSLLRLVFGTTDVDFGLALGEGEVEGNFVRNSELSQVALEISDVSIAGLAPVEEIVQLPMVGLLAGHVDFTMPEGKLANADGNLELTIDSLEVGDGKAKIRDTIALPKLRAGNLKLSAEALQGKLDLKEFSANGPDFQLKSEGSLRLRDPAGSSLADVRIGFLFKDGYKNKSDITRGLFGSPDSQVPGLFDLDPKIKRAKGPDGFYNWRAGGQLSHMSFVPATEGGSTPRTKTRPQRPQRTKATRSKPRNKSGKGKD